MSGGSAPNNRDEDEDDSDDDEDVGDESCGRIVDNSLSVWWIGA